MTKQPVQKIQHGRISAAVWENEGKEGTFRTVTFERSYQDGEEIKNTGSFGLGSDLANLERCIFDLKVSEANRKQS